jgi:hypothetical protein
MVPAAKYEDGRKRTASDFDTNAGVKVVVKNSFVDVKGDALAVEERTRERAMSDTEVDYTTLEEHFDSDIERADDSVGVEDTDALFADCPRSPVSSEECFDDALVVQSSDAYGSTHTFPEGATGPPGWAGLMPVFVSWCPWPQSAAAMPCGWDDQMPPMPQMYPYYQQGFEQEHFQPQDQRQQMQGRVQRRSKARDPHLTERAVNDITSQLIRQKNHTGRVWIPEWRELYGYALGPLRQFLERHPNFRTIPGDTYGRYTVALVAPVADTSCPQPTPSVEKLVEWPELTAGESRRGKSSGKPVHETAAQWPSLPSMHTRTKPEMTSRKQSRHELPDSMRAPKESAFVDAPLQEIDEDTDDWGTFLSDAPRAMTAPPRLLPPAPNASPPSLPTRPPRRGRHESDASCESPSFKSPMMMSLSQPTTSPGDSIGTMSPAEDDVDCDDGDWLSFLADMEQQDTSQKQRCSRQMPLAPTSAPAEPPSMVHKSSPASEPKAPKPPSAKMAAILKASRAREPPVLPPLLPRPAAESEPAQLPVRPSGQGAFGAISKASRARDRAVLSPLLSRPAAESEPAQRPVRPSGQAAFVAGAETASSTQARAVPTRHKEIKHNKIE